MQDVYYMYFCELMRKMPAKYFYTDRASFVQISPPTVFELISFQLYKYAPQK